MTIAEENLEELLLAGYAPLSASGFALPCYAARRGANEWYVARCSISGDHDGLIDGFDLYEGGDVRLLPEKLERLVRVGDRWIDVFLWCGVPFVGSATEVWTQLTPQLNEALERSPLSFLALALAAGREDVRTLAAAAIGYLEVSFGSDLASEWHRDNLVAGEVRLVVRRALLAAGAGSDEIRAARLVTMARTEDGFIAEVPLTVSTALLAREAWDVARSLVARAGERLGETIKLAREQRTSAPAVDLGRAPGNKAWWPGQAVSILVVVAGPRAKEIARHVSPPDWIPMPHAPEPLTHWSVRTKSFELPATGSVFDVIEADMLPPAPMERYSVVVWLIDDLSIARSPYDAFGWENVAGSDGPYDAVHLLAPALPTRGASETLIGLADGQFQKFSCHCVVDTSLARSPFWTGNPWRSIDRRVADVLVGSALLCALEGPIRAELQEAGHAPGGKGRLLSIALGDGNLAGKDPQLGLVSENSVTGLVRPDRDRLDIGFGVTGLDRSVRGATRGYASLRRADQEFVPFAIASVAMAARIGASKGPVSGSTLPPIARRSIVAVPKSILQALATPDLATMLEVSGSQPFVVTAEAPTLRAVRAAWKKGYTVVRYGDGETIRELLRVGSMVLPRDLRLPALVRRPENRGLAVRGVDPRDIARLPINVAEGILARPGGSVLAVSARRYLARVDERESDELVFPRAELMRLRGDGDPLAKALLEAAGKEPTDLGKRPLKRPTDLRAAWRYPEGVRRFVIEDGRLPAEVMELPADMVPAQRMFFMDGDLAVPLLLSSRVFGIWARATTSWSTSWLSRFSIGGTFETLPLPPCFRLSARGERPALRLVKEREELRRVARSLATTIDRGGHWARGEQGFERPSKVTAAWREVDRLILDSIGLSHDANDADVLQQMLDLSGK